MTPFAYRFEAINHVLFSKHFRKYLEIGVNRGDCFKRVRAEIKEAVDPEPRFHDDRIFQCTSDEFFESLQNMEADLGTRKEYEVIFIDGLHECRQVYKDVLNAIEFTVLGGIICLHDINPPTYESQLVPKVSSPWKGDVWRAWIKFVEKFPGNCFTSQDDTGLGWMQVDAELKDWAEEERNYFESGPEDEASRNEFLWNRCSQISYEAFEKFRVEYLRLRLTIKSVL